MIDDPYERTRAILWMLADLDPEMPLLSALGHMKAIEGRLDTEAVQAAEQSAAGGGMPSPAKAPAGKSRYSGGQGVINLVRDYAGHATVRDAAKRGDRAAVATELAALTGCGATEAINAAETLVSTLGT